MRYSYKIFLFVLFVLPAFQSISQKSYFVDGCHGGIWGHFPEKYTAFMVDMLNKHPDWKVNLEIEPETWDQVQTLDAAAYNDFKKLFADQSATGRIEIVNPSYGQSYLFNISGESIIRQFAYGIKKTRDHFPNAVFSTYSSEEPCFTTALPQILKSFGFKYASLKNPNTCWGGYTRAFGGELVNWIGPDGTKLPTSSRYEIEKLKTTSTWETIASTNSQEYVNAAFRYGIKHPVGMCLQDAGWRFGPWLGEGRESYKPTEYVTWRNYFENITIKTPQQYWKFSQEDVLVSLVWGAQVTQKIAQQVRISENKITAAEKIAALASILKNINYPNNSFDKAWRNLLLAQHHDCWIVPYNYNKGLSWAQHVTNWTGITNRVSDSVIQTSLQTLFDASENGSAVRVLNTTATPRNESVDITLPETLLSKANVLCVKDATTNQIVLSQLHGNILSFKANAPAFGYNTYMICQAATLPKNKPLILQNENGLYVVETDMYKITLDANHGGIIKNLIAKKLGNKEFVDLRNERKFNELRGHFYNDGGFHSSADNKASIEIVEAGPLKTVVEINGSIVGVPFTQTLTLIAGDPVIDCKVKINWTKNIGIGEYSEEGRYKNENYRKAFYNDRFKLLTLFPANLTNQKVYKNAPFDVTESKLENTFFSSWDSIKNNVILNWVDVTDAGNNYGLALFSDHTTSYTHGKDFPLGLNIQYSGQGLFGPDYKIDTITEIHYALLPHKNKWDKARIWTENVKWNEPLIVTLADNNNKSNAKKSFVSFNGKGWEITSFLFSGNDVLVRIYNAENNNSLCRIQFAFNVAKAELVELNGNVKEILLPVKVNNNSNRYAFLVPKFGFRTIRLTGAALNH